MQSEPNTESPSPPSAPPASATPEPVYAFPTRVRCPACGSLDTERYSGKEKKQYRKCRVPACRYSFTVIGTPV